MRIHSRLLLSSGLLTLFTLSLVSYPVWHLINERINSNLESLVDSHLHAVDNGYKQLAPLMKSQLVSLSRSAEIQAMLTAHPQLPAEVLNIRHLAEQLQNFTLSNPLFSEVVMLSDRRKQLAWVGRQSDPFGSFPYLHPELIKKTTTTDSRTGFIDYLNPHSKLYEKWISIRFTPSIVSGTQKINQDLPKVILLGKADNSEILPNLAHIFVDKWIYLSELNRRMEVTTSSHRLQGISFSTYLQAKRESIYSSRIWGRFDKLELGLKIHRLGDKSFLSIVDRRFFTRRYETLIQAILLLLVPTLVIFFVSLRVGLNRQVQLPLNRLINWFTDRNFNRDGYLQLTIEKEDSSEIRKLKQTLNRAKHKVDDMRSRLIADAITDPYTGLANDKGLTEQIQALTNTPSEEFNAALLHFRIDGYFSLAHRAGSDITERILRLLIKRLQREINNYLSIYDLEGYSQLYRLKHDELALFVKRLNQQQAMKLAVELKKTASKQILHHGHATDLKLITGIAIYPESEAISLRNHAHQAMELAEARSSILCCYDKQVMDYWARMEKLEKLIAQSDFNKDLNLLYQPIVSSSNLQIVAMEAVVRFNHSTGATASTEELLRLCNKTGRNLELDKWVSTDAIRTLSLLTREGFDNLPIAINASTSAFCTNEYISGIDKRLDRFNIRGERLVIELNESSLLSEQLRVIRNAEALYVSGVGVSIDNLGTDSTSLAVLRELPLHSFKISSEIVSELGKSRAAENVIDIAHIFDIPTIATGVETEYQERRLKQLGCSHLQGKRFYPPLSYNELLDTLFHSGNPTGA